VSTPDKYIGRYKIVDRIGGGGMGSLYLAHDPAIDRMVAIKALKEGFDTEELRERFARESRAAGRLRHPNIVTIFDVGEHDGQPFIAMEYVPGETLAQLIRRRPAMPQSRKVRLIEEICDGLAYAHRSGIIHRDVKPANLMLDAEGMVKILDFGIVRIADSGITQAGVLVGTVNYMSPEQVTGSGVDHRSDLFAVGAVGYELLAYRQAFPGTLRDGVLHRILHTDPPALAQVCPDIDPALPPIIARALEKDVTGRYQDLKAMQRDLSRVRERLEDEEAEHITHAEADPETAVVDTRPLRTPTPRPAGREGIEQRRAALISQHLEAAVRALDAKDFEKAIAAADEAVLLDPTSARANEILDRAHAALEVRRAAEWTDEARRHFEQGDLDKAAALVERALDLRLDAPEARTIGRHLQELRREVERARERALHVRQIFDRGQASLAQGALELAVRAADEALALQPGHSAAAQLKAQAVEALARRQEQEDSAAAEAVREARRRFAAGQRAAALALLEHHQPHHEAVSATLEDLRREAAALERQAADQARRAAEAKRREDERRRIEAEREAREKRVAALRAGAEHAASQGRYDEAIARVQQAREIQPESEVLARLLQKIGEAKEAAEEAARRKTAANQKLAPLADLLAARRLEPAERLALDVLALDPGNPDALRARDELRRQRTEFTQLLGQGREALRRSRFGDARQALERARAIDPHAAEAQQLLHSAVEGQAAAEREEQQRLQTGEKLDAATRALTHRDFEAALALVDEALALTPGAAAAGRLKAEIESAARAAGQRQAAIAGARDQLAARLSAGDLQKADTLVREILRLDPDDAQARAAREDIARRRRELSALLEAARAALGEDRLDEAQQALERCRAIDAGSREIDRLFKRLNDAIASRERRERRRREAADALANAATALDAGDLDAAAGLIEAAAAVVPDAPEIEALRRRVRSAHHSRPTVEPPPDDTEATRVLPGVAGGLSRPEGATPRIEAPPAPVILPTIARGARDYAARARQIAGSRAAQYAAAALVLVLVVVLVRALLPDAPPESADAYLAQAVQHLASGDREAALTSIVSGLAIDRSHTELQARLTQIVDDAAKAAEEARAQALAKGLPQDNPDLQAADEPYKQAQQARTAGEVARIADGVRGFWTAADRFRSIPAPPAKTPAVAKVREEWERGDKQKALDLLVAELKSDPQNGELRAYLQSPIHQAALEAAAAAEASAQQAGSSAAISEAFREAATHELEGRQTPPTPAGVRALWEAAARYTTAAQSAPADTVQAAERLLGKRDRDRALALLVAASRRHPGSAAIGALLRKISSDAASESAGAKRDAATAGASATSPDFTRGAQAEAEARRSASAGNHEAAVREYLSAADAFRRARDDARAEAAATAELSKAALDQTPRVIRKYLGSHPHWSQFTVRAGIRRTEADTRLQTAKAAAEKASATGTPSFKEGARLEQEARDGDVATAIEKMLAAAGEYREAPGEVPRPDPGPGTKTGTKTGTPPDPDIAAIEALLQEYAAAYSRMDLDTIGRIWPGSRAVAEQQFPMASSVQLTIGRPSIEFPGPNRAIVRCQVTYKYSWKRAGLPPGSSNPTVLSLEKRGGNWVIVNK
jgi:serine/threonine-protein kinase